MTTKPMTRILKADLAEKDPSSAAEDAASAAKDAASAAKHVPPGGPKQAASAAIAAAARCLAAGGLLAFPTATVPGLAADPCNGEALPRPHEAHGAPAVHPLM